MEFSLLPPARGAMMVRETRSRGTAERALRESEAYFRALVENARDVIHVINADGTTRYITPSVTRSLGWTPEELAGRPAGDLLHPDDLPAALAAIREDRGDPGSARSLEFRVAHRDGGWRVFEAVGKNLLDDPLVNAVVVNSRDVTERKQAEEETARLAAIPRENPYPVLECDLAGRVRYLNPAAERLLAELQVEVEAFLPAHHAELVAGAAAARAVETRVGERLFAWSYHPHPAAGAVHLFCAEITERKRTEARLLHAARHDALTGLANRVFFLERLAERIGRWERGEAPPFAVLFLDLDRFKVVNDSLGHQAGDELLTETARRLRALVGPRETVARFGGDEFAILLDHAGEAAIAAQRVVEAVSAPVALRGYEVFTGASVGVALAEPGHDSADILLRNADVAMYRAKGEGRRRWALFDGAMHDAAVARLEMEADLHRAVERGELCLHYQPIVSLASGRMEGVEALLRWTHPRRGPIAPADFIPVAEETGAILPIGEWVVREACRQLAEWRAEFPGARMAVTVNLSARQLSQRDLVERIRAAVDDAGLAPRHLRLEITESAVMENTETARGLLAELKAMGVLVYMDDFGTGYSSLSSLHSLPLDGLKVDRSFVGRLGVEQGPSALVRAIAGLARGLGLTLVAEGVETAAQMAEVRALGCDYAQGYLISRPLPAPALRARLAADPEARGA